MIENNGVHEPARGLYFHENDEATKNEYKYVGIK
jgi:hypothetical protein